ncbi:MAG: uridine diphosphate-N-acetylglucosamine-binding protein YvcK [Deltaproteobacteria bacterium]|nr:uridine diphosphate-N-acetylglucosamine-binding protein YvcK [Deltaproteobacteria bacterium]
MIGSISSQTYSLLRDVRTVVAFGGGTGLGRVLSSLSALGEDLSGVVTTTDDGGSTGRLRRASGCIAWGDLRHCFNQICNEPTLGRLLFEYRFADSGELSGHNLGNLMLLALDQITARPLDAVDLVRDLLNVEPRLIPMSEESTSLEAEGPEGQRVSGETAVDAMSGLPRRLWLEPEVHATPEVLEAIAKAQLILLGPGSFITSVLPSLLVPGIRDAVAAATCPRVLLANLTPEAGPVRGLGLRKQLQWMHEMLGVEVVDAILWPTSRPLHDPPLVPVQKADVVDETGRHHRVKTVAALAALLDVLRQQVKTHVTPDHPPRP